MSIIETDVNVDFAPPPGYKEPIAPPKQEGSSSRPGQVIFGEDKVGGKPGIESKGRKLVESSDSESEEEGESKTAQPEQRFPGDVGGYDILVQYSRYGLGFDRRISFPRI